MRKFIILVTSLLAILSFGAVTANAAAISDSAVYELNRMNSATRKHGLGTQLRLSAQGSATQAVAALSFDISDETASLVAYDVDGHQMRRVARATYNVAASATMGDIGDHASGVILPDNAVVTRAWIDTITALDSAADGASISVTAESAADVCAVTVEANVSGFFDCLTDTSTGLYFKTTEGRDITFTIADESLTTGKIVLFLEYVVSE